MNPLDVIQIFILFMRIRFDLERNHFMHRSVEKKNKKPHSEPNMRRRFVFQAINPADNQRYIRNVFSESLLSFGEAAECSII